MQNDKNYSEIFEEIQTKEDAGKLSDEIEILISSLYKKDISFEDVLNSKVSKKTADKIRTYLVGANVEETLKDIQNKISSLTEVNIRIAFEPSISFISYLTQWMRENLDGSAILEVEIDPSIIAGVVVIYKGKYIDLSLAKRLSKEKFLENI